MVLLAGLRIFSGWRPTRPANTPSSATWRPTPTEARGFQPHGDWVSCSEGALHNHCVLTDAVGKVEYDGDFTPVPQGQPIANARLQPIVSETITPWMWSGHANRLVPILQMEDGAVLVPTESEADLRGYVERMQKLNARANPLPLYLDYQRARASSQDKKAE